MDEFSDAKRASSATSAISDTSISTAPTSVTSTPIKKTPTTTANNDNSKTLNRTGPSNLLKPNQVATYAFGRELSPTRPKATDSSSYDQNDPTTPPPAPKRKRAGASDYDRAVNAVPEVELTYWRVRCAQLESENTDLEVQNTQLKKQLQKLYKDDE